jgi:hypothetical protein
MPARKVTKTVDVQLLMNEDKAREWLRARRIPFTHMRELSGGGTAFRIRHGYYGDFRHQKDASAPCYNSPRQRAIRAATTRRRNPTRPKSRAPSIQKKYNTTVNALHVEYFQGYAEDIRYLRSADGKPYSHVVETDSAELYLCEHATYGKCLLIVDPSGKTPLWG